LTVVEPPPVDVSTLRELYTTPPALFVAARNQLVKERRAAKDREGAAAVGKLRKPGMADWALNVVAAEHGDDIAAFLTAAGTVRDAQAAAIEGRDGPDVRAALRDLRERTGQVLTRGQEVLAGAGRDAAAEAGTVAGRLAEVAGNAEASAQLAAGVLGSSVVVPEEVFGGLEPGERPAPRRRTRSVSPNAPSNAEAVTQTATARERKRELAAATKARETAARTAERAEAAVEKAAAAVRNAERQLEKSRDALASAESDRDDAARTLAEAEEALQRAADAT
jgi:hypothetical protein